MTLEEIQTMMEREDATTTHRKVKSIEWHLDMVLDSLEDALKAEATTDDGNDALTMHEAAIVYGKMQSAHRALRIARESIRAYRRS